LRGVKDVCASVELLTIVLLEIGKIFNFVFLLHFIIFDTTVCAVIAGAYLIHLAQLARDLIDRSMR
jgi:hypothetical protein